MEIYMDAHWLREQLLPRALDSHKGHLGTLTIIGGCTRYRGAVVLAAAGAHRAGAGLVRVAAIEKVCAAVAAQLPCVIYQPLPEDDAGGISAECRELVSELIACRRQDALLVGGGMGNTASTAAIVEQVLDQADCPLILDADALNVLSGHFDTGYSEEARQKGLAALRNAGLKGRPAVISPHIGEMSRLCGLPPGEIVASQSKTAQDFAQAYQCIVVLKSHATVIAPPAGNRLWINRLTGNAGLACGGSGDVLAGIMASIAAQGIEPATAAAAGVWLHASSADLAAADYGYAGMSPDDLPKYLGRLWKKLER